MLIIIEIKNKLTKLILKKGKKRLDEIIFSETENLSQKLLPNFDLLLQRNKLTVNDINNVKVETDLGEAFISRRIAEAFANCFNYKKI